MLNSTNQGLNAPLVLVVLLAAMTAGGVYIYETPFQVWRPKSEDLGLRFTLGPEQVLARLWQDPFTAVDQYLNKENETIPNDRSSENHSLGQFGGKQLAELAQQIVSRDEKKIIIMPVMVNGGSYAEEIEQRRRTRYAVLSALGVAGYVPRNAEYIGYFQTPWPDNIHVYDEQGEQSGTQKRQEPSFDPESLVVPYELVNTNKAAFEDEQGPEPVLVLWLNGDVFTESPLARLVRLFDLIKHSLLKATIERSQDSSELAFEIIGPAESRTLHAMTREVKKDKQKLRQSLKALSRETIEIYSPVATVSARMLLEKPGTERQAGCSNDAENDINESNVRATNSFLSSLTRIDKAFDSVGINFFRTVTSDTSSAKTLLCAEFNDYRRIDVKDPKD